LGFIDGLERNPVTLSLRVPDDWPTFATLDPERRPRGSLTVTAPNFLGAADAQYGAGPALTVRPLVAPVPAVLALYHEGPLDVDRLTELGQRALQRTIAWFGTAPFAHYTIHYELLRPVSAGHSYQFSQEHLASATFRGVAGELALAAAD